MELFMDVSAQVGVLFLLIAAGFSCAKLGYISSSVSKGLSEFVINFVTPCVILNAFQSQMQNADIGRLLIAVAAAAGSMVVPILLFRLAFAGLRSRRGREAARSAAASGRSTSKIALMEFASVYSNCGFMGLPLLEAIFGGEGIVYGTMYIIVFNLLVFTHGIMIISGERFSFKSLGRALLSPAILAVGASFAMFALKIRLPEPFYGAVGHMAALNTPLPMVIIGVRIAESNLREFFTDRLLLPPVLIRNLIIPLCTLCALLVLGLRGPMLGICVLTAAMPVAGNTVIFAERYNANAQYASGVLTLSTLASILTVPFIVTLAMLS